MKMIIHKGIRVRPEDAERYGVQPEAKQPEPAKPKRARNKARAVAEEAAGGDAPA